MRNGVLLALGLATVAGSVRADEENECRDETDLRLVLKTTLPEYRAEGPTAGKGEHHATERARLDAATRVTVEQRSCPGRGSETKVRFDLAGERHSTADLLFWVRRARALAQRLRPALRESRLAESLLILLAGDEEALRAAPWQTAGRGAWRRHMGEFLDVSLDVTESDAGAALIVKRSSGT